MDNDFDNLVNSFFATPANGNSYDFYPKLDIKEYEGWYAASVDLPGFETDKINIELSDNNLIITGERSNEHHDENTNWTHNERSFGQFRRSFTLPESVDAEKIEANYENGVLQVLLPKAEITKPKSIEVKSSEKGFFEKLIGKN